MKSGSAFVLLLMSWTIYPQNHFESVDSTGLPYQVIILTDNIIGYQLQNGDEIGLFADTLCVGADVYNGSGNFAVTAWEGSDQYNLPGFHNGDSIRVFIWADIGGGVGEYEMEPIFTVGNGTFGYGSYTACYFAVAVPFLEVSATEYDFGNVIIGSESDTWTFTIMNTGQAAMTFGLSLQTDSVFTLSYYTISSLEPQDSLQVGVNFIPSALGVHTDTVFISSSAPMNGSATVILRGMGADTSVISVNVEYFPGSFLLNQNYPNPFNPLTTIPYDIPIISHVKLVVYNSNGQEAAVLLDETQEAGSYVIKWNAGNLASGVYLITLEADGKTVTKRGVLLK